MEPQIIDYYNELPQGVNVIEKLNEELDIVQKHNNELNDLNLKLLQFKEETEKCPLSPVDDVNGNYIWINLHTSSDSFRETQEEGFIISMSEYKSHGNVWLRKLRSLN